MRQGDENPFHWRCYAVAGCCWGRYCCWRRHNPAEAGTEGGRDQCNPWKWWAEGWGWDCQESTQLPPEADCKQCWSQRKRCGAEGTVQTLEYKILTLAETQGSHKGSHMHQLQSCDLSKERRPKVQGWDLFGGKGINIWWCIPAEAGMRPVVYFAKRYKV